MGLILPDEGASLNVWAPLLDTAIGATGGGIDAHDHSAGKGVKVPSAGLNINADVTANSHSITDVLALDFAPTVAANVTGFAGAFWLNSVDSNLYYRTTAGVNFQVTNGSSLNISGFVGGIGGDYSAAGALVVFDDATDSYWFQQQVGATVRQYARMRNADVDLYEYKANPAAGVPTNRVRLASPTALAASYALTFPAALPASAAIVTIDNAGLIKADTPTSQSLSIGQPVTFGAASTTSFAAAATFSGTINANGDIKHSSSRTTYIHPSVFIVASGVAPGGYVGVFTAFSGRSYCGFQITTSTGIIGIIHAAVLGLRVGDRVSGASVIYTDTAGLPSITSINLNRQRVTTGSGVTATNIATGSSTASLSEWEDNVSGSYTLVAGDTIWVELVSSTSTTRVVGVSVTYTRP